jgi:hypothetical protein
VSKSSDPAAVSHGSQYLFSRIFSFPQNPPFNTFKEHPPHQLLPCGKVAQRIEHLPLSQYLFFKMFCGFSRHTVAITYGCVISRVPDIESSQQETRAQSPPHLQIPAAWSRISAQTQVHPHCAGKARRDHSRQAFQGEKAVRWLLT